MRQLQLLGMALLMVIIIPSCSKTDIQAPDTSTETSDLSYASKSSKSTAQVAIDWMNGYRSIVQTESKNPPQASRIYAYAAIGLYEAVVPGMGGYKSLEGQIPGLVNLPNKFKKGQLDFTLAANEALYQISLSIFGTLNATNLSRVEALHKLYMDDALLTLKSKEIIESVDYGKAVAVAVLNRANNDNFAATRTLTYVVPSTTINPLYWSPTGAVTNPLEPYWGNLLCYAMPNGAACTIKSTIPFSTDPTSAFYIQALEVVSTTNNLTQAQKDIALWWADGAGATPTPPGHWVGICTNIAAQRKLNLGEAAEMFAKVNIAMGDAFISCWNEKYAFNLLRPLSYIRTYIPGQSTWTPLLGTPPFPEYPSGHSVSSGAAAEMLTKMFGKNVAFTDSANISLGLSPRTFSSFEAAAKEAAISRLYGGIHFREAIDKGITQGQGVATTLLTKIRFK